MANVIQVFYINDECGLQQNLTNDSSFSMIKASQIKGSILMKKILKLSIVLLGALFVLLGCRSESKASFVFQTANAEVTFTYVYDKGNDTVLSLTTKSVMKLANIPEYDTITRRIRDELVNEMKDIEGIKVTTSDSEKELNFTVEVDMKKFKLDDSESRAKAPELYRTMDVALIKKDDKISFSASKESLESKGFVEQKEEKKYRRTWIMANVIQVFLYK